MLQQAKSSTRMRWLRQCAGSRAKALPEMRGGVWASAPAAQEDRRGGQYPTNRARGFLLERFRYRLDEYLSGRAGRPKFPDRRKFLASRVPPRRAPTLAGLPALDAVSHAFRTIALAHHETIARRHLAERNGLLGHDQSRVVVDEDDDVATLFDEIPRPAAQLIVSKAPCATPGESRIDLDVDEPVGRKDRQHHFRALRLPFGRHRRVGHPQTEEVAALARPVRVNAAADALRAVAAPDARRLFQLGNMEDLAAQGAGSARAPRRGRQARNALKLPPPRLSLPFRPKRPHALKSSTTLQARPAFSAANPALEIRSLAGDA